MLISFIAWWFLVMLIHKTFIISQPGKGLSNTVASIRIVQVVNSPNLTVQVAANIKPYKLRFSMHACIDH
jgi:hypothetical protein